LGLDWFVGCSVAACHMLCALRCLSHAARIALPVTCCAHCAACHMLRALRCLSHAAHGGQTHKTSWRTHERETTPQSEQAAQHGHGPAGCSAWAYGPAASAARVSDKWGALWL